jgi:hypothetical protein
MTLTIFSLRFIFSITINVDHRGASGRLHHDNCNFCGYYLRSIDYTTHIIFSSMTNPRIFFLSVIVFCLLLSLTYQNTPRQLNYPIRAGYINRVTSWWGAGVTRDLAVPGEAVSSTIDYNYILLGYWTCGGSPHDIAQLWSTIGNWGVTGHGSNTQ